MKNIDLFNLNKNYVCGGKLVTHIDEFIGTIEENGEEKIVLPSNCECLGDKVENFELEKQYRFDKRLIPTYMKLSGWEKEIDGEEVVKVISEKAGYCFNDKGECYIVYANWCMEV